jgi:REP element-mobilizing transposase RayT
MPEKFKNKYRISSTRAPWHDYAKTGKYFITICTKHRKHYFGKIINRKIELTETGVRVLQDWLNLPMHFQNLVLDEFTIMPNHFHGIIIIDKMDDGICDDKNENDVLVETGHALSLQSTKSSIPQPKHPRYGNQGKKTVSAMVGSFKSAVTKWCNENNLTFGWQTRFHDHIIRDDSEYHRIRRYIINNPGKWEDDRFYGD